MKRLERIINNPELITLDELQTVMANKRRMLAWSDQYIPIEEGSETHLSMLAHMNSLLLPEGEEILNYSDFIKVVSIYILLKESGAI